MVPGMLEQIEGHKRQNAAPGAMWEATRQEHAGTKGNVKKTHTRLPWLIRSQKTPKGMSPFTKIKSLCPLTMGAPLGSSRRTALTIAAMLRCRMNQSEAMLQSRLTGTGTFLCVGPTCKQSLFHVAIPWAFHEPG